MVNLFRLVESTISKSYINHKHKEYKVSYNSPVGLHQPVDCSVAVNVHI